MCGIAGKVSSEAAVAPNVVERMCDALIHRGPDSRGIHRGDGAALGIQRLRVIDLETGDQPVYNETRDVAVILNGEIYNYRELRAQLERRGHSFSTDGDTEVIAHLYEEQGPDCVRSLHGMFAVALWDQRRRRLMLARDRVGKKPLYYAERNGWLSFASELRALMTDDQIPREIDPTSVQCYLALGYIPAPWSVWQGVRKLPPAHTLVWEDGRSSLDRYWRLRYDHKRTESRPELEEELRHVIGAAVRRRMVADVPLGAFLSGGIDSSIVVTEMAMASTQPIKTFSAGFSNMSYNELPRARLVAERLQTEHHEFMVGSDMAEMLPTVAVQYGEPFSDSSAIPSLCLARETRSHVTVALNGDGGDESFAGYPRHLANAGTAWLDRVPRAIRRAGAAAGALIPPPADRKSRRDYARRMLASLGGDAVERYADHVSVFDSSARRALTGSQDGAPVEYLRRAWEASSATRPLDRLLDVDVQTYLPGDLLPKVDIACMTHSLEARSPLLDHELMELAASLPVSMKASVRSGKAILRSAYRGKVPDAVLDGPKMGFAVPLADWFRGALGSQLREQLADASGRVSGTLDRSFALGLLDAHEQRRGDHSAKLWALAVLMAWERSELTQ